MIRKALWAVLATALPVHAAFAGPSFTFTFDPRTYDLGGASGVNIFATITNTGSTDIVGAGGTYATLGTIAPYVTGSAGYGGTGDIEDQFDGVDIKPGDSYQFFYLNLFLSGVPDGQYTLLSSAYIDLYNSAYIGNSNLHDATQSYATNVPILKVGVPEPASWTMMLLGFGGLGAVLRTRRRLNGRLILDTAD